jgi:hypothetical protein
MKIGITFNMSVAVWANGMQQNIVFLYSLLKSAGHDCYYITQEAPRYSIHKDHKGMILDDLMDDKKEVLDVLIVAGFDLFEDMYKKLKKRNPSMKIILIHYGNKLMDDTHYGISGSDSKSVPVKTPYQVDQIWTSPHYEFAVPYLKTYYNNENVKLIPYIWDSFFVDEKVKLLKEKNLSPEFNQSKSKEICIFEPNKTHSKNSLIPIMICERYYQLFGDGVESINIFCCENIRERKFFKLFINRLNIGKKEEFMYFNNRWGALEACSKFGKTVVSHQLYNQLNYSHFEKLYLGLPLIHNCEMLEDVGYYYPEFDVDMGAKQLKNSFENHASTIKKYKQDGLNFIKKFSIKNKENIETYSKFLSE